MYRHYCGEKWQYLTESANPKNCNLKPEAAKNPLKRRKLNYNLNPKMNPNFDPATYHNPNHYPEVNLSATSKFRAHGPHRPM